MDGSVVFSVSLWMVLSVSLGMVCNVLSGMARKHFTWVVVGIFLFTENGTEDGIGCFIMVLSVALWMVLKITLWVVHVICG